MSRLDADDSLGRQRQSDGSLLPAAMGGTAEPAASLPAAGFSAGTAPRVRMAFCSSLELTPTGHSTLLFLAFNSL